MEIVYKNEKVEGLCKNISVAKKLLERFSKHLIAKINYIESAESFKDILAYVPMRCHQLSGDRADFWGVDIAGRQCSWRIIIAPLDDDYNIIKPDAEFFKTCTKIKIVLVEEVVKHYEK